MSSKTYSRLKDWFTMKNILLITLFIKVFYIYRYIVIHENITLEAWKSNFLLSFKKSWVLCRNSAPIHTWSTSRVCDSKRLSCLVWYGVALRVVLMGLIELSVCETTTLHAWECVCVCVCVRPPPVDALDQAALIIMGIHPCIMIELDPTQQCYDVDWWRVSTVD